MTANASLLILAFGDSNHLDPDIRDEEWVQEDGWVLPPEEFMNDEDWPI